MTLDVPFVFSVVRLLAVFGRVTGFLMAVPVFTAGAVPRRYRVAFGFGLTVLLLPGLPAEWGSELRVGMVSLPFLVLTLVSELILGATVALVVHLVWEVFTVSGQLIGRDMGFAMARAFDPTVVRPASMISVLLGYVFAMLFLVRGAHFDVLHLAALSLRRIPPGGYLPTEADLAVVVELGSWMFVMAVRLALPVICMVLLVNIAMGLMTKFGQEFQVLMLAFPIRIGLGLFMLTAALPVMVRLGGQVVDTMLLHVEGLMPPT